MARSWHYSRWRRTFMQGALCLILAGTMGLAQWVSVDRQRLYSADLKQAITNDRLTLQLPTKWNVVGGGNGNAPLVAREPLAAGGRALTILRQPVAEPTTPTEFLLRSGLLNGTFVVGENSQEDDRAPADESNVELQAIKIAGLPGVMVHVQRPISSPMGMPNRLQNEWIACTVLSSRTAIIMVLTSSEQSDPANDANLLINIAAGMKLSGENPAQMVFMLKSQWRGSPPITF